MKIADAEKIANVVLDWCIAEFGMSAFHKELPLIYVEYGSDWNVYRKTPFGMYDKDENIIFIFTKRHHNVKQLVNTVLHEYKHFLQSPTWMERYIAKYGCGYKNPYEVQAEEFGWFFCDRCMKDLIIT
jgi:hypothetical protein